MNYSISEKNNPKDSLLDNTSITRRLALNKKKSRFFQRIKSFITILQSKHIKGYRFSFLTLTSSYQSSSDILDDWAILKKRIERRYDKIWYFAVREYNEKGDLIHLHILLYSPYIPIEWISSNWQDIHNAKIVYIENVDNNDKAVSYMSKYMSKTLDSIIFARSFTYSLIFPRLAKCWNHFIKYYIHIKRNINIKDLIYLWNKFLLNNSNWNDDILNQFISSMG